MARIRTVKPELWTDPEFVELSLSARLLFIASLNFASDYGVLPDKPRQLKMQCLPADDVDVVALIEELVSAHFYIRDTAPNGDKVLLIRTFTTHQKVNRKHPGRWGDPEKWPSERQDADAFTERSLPEHPRMGRDDSDNSDDLDSAVSTLTEPSPVDEPENIRLERGQVLRLLTENGAPAHLTQRPVAGESA